MAAIVSSSGRQNQLPTSSEPISTFGANNVPTRINSEWYKFFVSLSTVLQNLVDGVLGFTVESGVVASGTTQATAAVTGTEWSEVNTTPANSGKILVGFGAGVPETVFNEGANSLRVYPPFGSQIDALGVNTPYVLAAGKMQTFFQTTGTQFRSTQLG